MNSSPTPPKIAVVGAGPAGLMAAETLLARGASVQIYDAMPSAGRKLLLAGKSGLNLTHSEPFSKFTTRYGEKSKNLAPYLHDFTPTDLRNWAKGLGIETFVGSSGRIFPVEMDALPLLRAWIARLTDMGADFRFKHRWLGWGADNTLRFATSQGESLVRADATILALGGGSYPKTGSNAAWIPLLRERGIAISPLKPANCGFDILWSKHIREKFAGTPVKTVKLSFKGITKQGEFVITETGIEGSLIYAFSAALRDEIEIQGNATFHLDLLPDWTDEKLKKALGKPRGSRSLASHLKKETGLTGIKANLLWEILPRDGRDDAQTLSTAIKALPVTVDSPRPLDEAISSAGGVRFDALDENLMLKAIPGLFCAGEMLDWEAPTGGYLLTACFATGKAAAEAAYLWVGGLGKKAQTA